MINLRSNSHTLVRQIHKSLFRNAFISAQSASKTDKSLLIPYLHCAKSASKGFLAFSLGDQNSGHGGSNVTYVRYVGTQ